MSIIMLASAPRGKLPCKSANELHLQFQNKPIYKSNTLSRSAYEKIKSDFLIYSFEYQQHLSKQDLVSHKCNTQDFEGLSAAVCAFYILNQMQVYYKHE